MNNLEETINKGPTKKARIEDFEHGTLAVITQGNENRPFRLKGVVKGQRITTLVDIGASHDFINQQLVERHKIATQNFKGFKVIMGNGTIDQCTKCIP